MEIIDSLLYMLGEMSPYILLGLLIAGLLHAFVPSSVMSRHLASPGWRSVVKAALFGVPLPLCSCGVLPTAVALRRGGASKAASASFLISTPQTGVDSIAATWSLLGPAFAVIRPVAAMVTAIAGGVAVGRSESKEPQETPIATQSSTACSDKCTEGKHDQAQSFGRKVLTAMRYGFFDMIQSIGGWLVAGLIIAALITVLVPADFFAALGERPLLAMLAVVIVAIPMYVCATGSIPIALSLMLKGVSPGTALVLLMAGPAANFASVAIISRTMGRRSAAIYLASIVLGSIAFGLAVDYLLPRSWFPTPASQGAMACHSNLSALSLICAAILVTLLIIAFAARLASKHKHDHNHHNLSSMTKEYQIKGMNCQHCKMSVERAIAALDGVESVTVDLSRGTATVQGAPDDQSVYSAIESAGFDPVRP